MNICDRESVLKDKIDGDSAKEEGEPSGLADTGPSDLQDPDGGGWAPKDLAEPLKSESEIAPGPKEDPNTYLLVECQRICELHGGPAQYLSTSIRTAGPRRISQKI